MRKGSYEATEVAVYDITLIVIVIVIIIIIIIIIIISHTLL